MLLSTIIVSIILAVVVTAPIVKNFIDRRLSRIAVLPGYTQPKNPIWLKVRNVSALGLIIFVGLVYGLLSAIFPVSFYLYLGLPLGLIVGALLFMIPDAPRPVPAAVGILFWAFLVAQLIWPNYLAISLPGLPWITINRLITAPLTILFLMTLSQNKGLRGRLWDIAKSSKLTCYSLIILAILQIATLPFSNTIAQSLNRMIDMQIQWNAIFFISCYIFSERGRARKFFVVYPWLILTLVIVAIFEWKAGVVLWAGHVPSFLNPGDEATQNILAGKMRSAVGVHRVQSIFSTPLNFAEVLALSIPVFVYWVLYAKRFVVRTGAVFSLPFIYWMTLQTDSRLGIVGFFASIILFAGLYALRRWRRKKDDLIGPAIILFYPFATALFYAATLLTHKLGNAVWGTGATAASDQGRAEQWAAMWPKLFAWPFGYGVANGASVLGMVGSGGILTIDSYYLVMLLDLGVIGFLAWACMLLSAAVSAGFQSLVGDDESAEQLMALTTFILVFVLIKGVLAQDDSHGIVYMVLGMICGMVWQRKAANSASCNALENPRAVAINK